MARIYPKTGHFQSNPLQTALPLGYVRRMCASPASIAFFAYQRADKALRALRSLRECHLSDQSYLRIFCDGPRLDSDRASTDQVRAAVRGERWCGRVEVVERKENWGLAKSIRSGVTELCEEFGRVIVLEDDLVVHPSFLEYMNAALSLYADDARVMQVSGYNYPVKIEADADAFFICHASCWGWATWKRAWSKFDDSDALYEKLKSDPGLRKKFDLGGAYPYFALLEKQRRGEIDSWGIYWYQTLFERRGLVLMPNETLVCNHGAGAGSTHESGTGFSDVMGNGVVRAFPKVGESADAEKSITRYLSRHFRPSFSLRSPRSWIRSRPWTANTRYEK